MIVKTKGKKKNLESLTNSLSEKYPGSDVVCLKMNGFLVNAVAKCGADTENLTAINWNPKEKAIECFYRVK